MSSETTPQTPAFQELTPENRGPVVIVASYIFLVITVIVVLTRLVTRFKVARRFVIDDALALASTVFLIAQTVAMTFAVNAGLGRHRNALSDTAFDEYAKVRASAPHHKPVLLTMFIGLLRLSRADHTGLVDCQVIYGPPDYGHQTTKTCVACLSSYAGCDQCMGSRRSVCNHFRMLTSSSMGLSG